MQPTSIPEGVHASVASLPQMRLTQLAKHRSALVCRVEDAVADDFIAARLRDLGFVAGEPIRVVARGPIGADPLLVQIGFTRFALRHAEASRVLVQVPQVLHVPHVSHIP